ncbi:unnamed protein product [Orchesella dallaii]|uniref:B30.2/SPRY domain-containing protein n=1 Tax=Orchesella dallaii TaxID=48710 RepID=A0ABP1Q6W7_9HEXA
MSDQNLESGLEEQEGMDDPGGLDAYRVTEEYEHEIDEDLEREREEQEEIAVVSYEIESERHEAEGTSNPAEIYFPPEQPTMGTFLQSLYSMFKSMLPFTEKEKPDDNELPLECLNIEELRGEGIDELCLFQPLYSDPDSRIIQIFPQWSSILHNGNHRLWEYRCKQLIPKHVLLSPLLKLVGNYRGKLRAFLGSWNFSPEHCSPNIFMLNDELTAHRIPAVDQTDAVRGKLGFTRGIHAWDLRIKGKLGSHFSIGVATDQSRLTTKGGYMTLVGDDEYSWGWDLVWGNLSTRGAVIANYPERTIYDFRTNDIIRMILDCERNELSFEVNGVGFGKAFVNLPRNKPLYPSVSLVYGNARVSIFYLGDPASVVTI